VSIHKLNLVRSDRLHFAVIKTCDALDELATPTLLFDVCNSAENLARQMHATLAKVAKRVSVRIDKISSVYSIVRLFIIRSDGKKNSCN